MKKNDKHLGIRLNSEERELLQKLSEINGRSTSGEVRRAIKEYIENNKHLIQQ